MCSGGGLDERDRCPATPCTAAAAAAAFINLPRPAPPAFPSSPLLQVGVKTLTGRSVPRDPLQSAEGWNKFTAGFAVGGLSGAAWGYICTQLLPYYS